MEFEKIISASGLSGLFEMVSAKKDGAIVRSLEDKTVKFISSRAHNFSNLETIEIFTTHDNVKLADVFIAMQNRTESLPDEKDAKAIRKYFEKVYPEMDFDRVYMSDMKKMIKWFQILKENNVEIKPSEVTETEEAENDNDTAAKELPKEDAAK